MSPTVVQPSRVVRRGGLLGVLVVLELQRALAGLEPHDAGLTGRQLVALLVEDVDRRDERPARPSPGARATPRS